MTRFQPRSTFDKVFEGGIILKGLDGIIEIVGGILLFFATPESLNKLTKSLTRGELSTDPHDLIARHLLNWSSQITKGALIFGAIYLLVRGVSKLVLVVEILRNHLWAYVGLIVLTGGFIIYQIYEIIVTHSISLILLTLFDVVIVYLTVREYKKQIQMASGRHGKE